jgi:hypothetical protein
VSPLKKQLFPISSPNSCVDDSAKKKIAKGKHDKDNQRHGLARKQNKRK